MLAEVDIYRGYLVNQAFPDLILTLPVTRHVGYSPYQVTNIEGLGPVTAELTTSGYAGWDGALMQNTRTGMRNIVMTMEYQPDYVNNSVESLRQNLYEILPPKAKVELRFKTGPEMVTRRIYAWVESHEPVLFTEKPTVQVSLLCPDPYFTSLSGVTVSGLAMTAFQMGPSLGSADTEFKLTLYPDRGLTWVSIDNLQEPKINWSGELRTGDVFVLSTLKGEKQITVNGVSALDGLEGGSLGLTISKAKNQLSIMASGTALFNAEVWYMPKYLGL